MAKPRKPLRRERSKRAIGNDIVLREQPAKLNELLAGLPPLADDAFPDEIADALPDPIGSF